MRGFRQGLAWGMGGIVLLATLAGCSSRVPTYATRGRVVYKDDGSPVKGGLLIWFESTEPPYHRSMSHVDQDGYFELDFITKGAGAPEGEHRIAIKPAEVLPHPNAEAALRARMDPRYLEFRTSGLKETISRDPKANEFVVKVEKEPRR